MLKINVSVGVYMMEMFQEYHLDVFHRNRYATFPCDNIKPYINENFDDLLLLLGKYYFERPDLGVNGVCSLIKDEINKEWNLNGLRKKYQLIRVTTSQVKSIRRSFSKINDRSQKFVRIPFNVTSIFFFILMLLARIDKHYSTTFIDILNRETLGDYLYKYHIDVFEDMYLPRVNALTDEELRQKYRTLYADLSAYNAFMRKHFSDLRWVDTTYIIK